VIVSSLIGLSEFGEESMAGQRIDAETEDYDYDSDSDLDDSELEDDLDDATNKPRSLGSAVSESEQSECTKLGTDATPEKLELVGAECTHRVVVPDVAANTYVCRGVLDSLRLIRYSMQALIHFIYTGHIHFAPLKSQGLAFRRSEKVKHREKNPHLPPLCSPKSVYRLANFVSSNILPFLRLFETNLCKGWNSRTSRTSAEGPDGQNIIRYYR
jgi:hypothetical protein